MLGILAGISCAFLVAQAPLSASAEFVNHETLPLVADLVQPGDPLRFPRCQDLQMFEPLSWRH